MNATQSRSTLTEAMRDGTLTRITLRGGEAGAYSVGFVVGLSDQLVLLNRLSDRIDLDGFAIARVRDITSVDADFRRKRFYDRALELKSITRQQPGAVDLTDVRSAVAAVAKLYPLLTVHRERIAPGEVAIGRVESMGKTTFRLRLIDPSAEWTEPAESYPYSRITRLEFGGAYEAALALVAKGI